jgi:hypothetical protein
MQPAEILLQKLQLTLRTAPLNIEAVCKIGRELGQLGQAEDSRKCYRIAVEALRRAAGAGDVERAIGFEFLIYKSFVRTNEDEQHYYRCFSDWKNDLAGMGRRFRDPAALSAEGASGIGFVLQAGPVLGHTQVLLKMLESRPGRNGREPEPRVYVLDSFESRFIEQCRAIGVEVVSVVKEMGAERPPAWKDRFLWLRNRLRQDRIRTSIWVSAPTMVAFAYSMRLAPVQIFWALRFHPISAPYIDGYITWGAPGEKTRRYGNQDWDVVPMPLAIDEAQPDPLDVASVRKQFPEEILLGTLSREEKTSSPAYLRAVAQVLAANPQTGFVWTGRSEHPGIAGFFRAQGIAERCHFVGWVDTKLYAAALDVFLETFPFGSGVTALQALGAGTPLLSYLHPETIFGTYFWPAVTSPQDTTVAQSQQPMLDSPDRHAILCARDGEEYVGLANRLIAEPSWRKEIGARGRTFFLDECRRTANYAQLFFDTIQRIVSAKLARPR